MASLGDDLLAEDAPARATFGVPLHGFDSAVEHAQREWEQFGPRGVR
jgi:hypothetical protein